MSDSLQQNELELEVANLYREYSGQLRRYACSMLRSDDLAEDSLQEVYLRYFIERSYGRQVEHPRAWLYRVLRNYLLDRVGKAAACREIGSDAAAGVPDDSAGPEERIRYAQHARELSEILSPRELECLQLRAEGLQYDEIGEVLGIAGGTVGALLNRMQRKLRDADEGDRSSRADIVGALRFMRLGESYAS